MKILERILWLTVLLCTLSTGLVWQGAHAAANRAAATGSRLTPQVAHDVVLGQLAIPALGLRVPVMDDDDTDSLLRGIGHIRGTAMPGGLGTVGLAGHRDTFLRPLAKIMPHMMIEVSRGPDVYRYLVDRTEIVHPEQVQVLDTQNTPELVLVTCYPFHYIGAAPLRFIVHAHLLSLAPETARP